MREQLKLLEELQRHDARLIELDALQKSLPQKLIAAEHAIAELERLLERERAELLDNETFRKGQEADQKDTQEQLTRAKAKLSQVKNMKESNAAQREVETTRRQLDTREEEVQKLGAALDQQRAMIADHEARLQQSQRDLGAQREATQARLSEIQGELAEAQKVSDEMAKQLRPEILKKYRNVRLRRIPAVVVVKDGTCGGCHMRIPPQLYNIIQRGSSLEQCPTCNRIIYWSKMLEEAASA